MKAHSLIEPLLEFLAPDQVLTGVAALKAYDCDAYTVDRFPPIAICFPATTEQVSRIVSWCNRESIPFTARGAGTGLSGGVLPALGGVVISTKKMTSIINIDFASRMLHAQAGIANRKLSDAVKSRGLHFAPDPSSQSVSTLGGNIAENAGGPHTLKYGVTSQHILQVTMVSVEGSVIQLGSLVPGAPGVDFLSLIVGGEGTLGIVTEAWVKLTPLPTAVTTMLVSFPTILSATQSVADIIASGTIPAALEMMDKGIMIAVEAAFQLRYPPHALALLLIECDSNQEDGDRIVASEIAMVEEIVRANGAIEIEIAQDEKARANLWTARKKSVGAMGRLAPSIVTHDGVIPRSKLPEMLDYVYQVADEFRLGVANMFHAGDGNLHPCFYFDDRDPIQVEHVVQAGEKIIRRCIELGGSITGEHGIGVEKLDLMPLMFTEDDLTLQRKGKEIFNSGSLCNPCKVLPNQKSCVEHKMRWRGSAW